LNYIIALSSKKKKIKSYNLNIKKMKKNNLLISNKKITLSLVAWIIIVWLGTANVFWMWNWNWNWKTAEKAHNPWEMINWVAKQNLDEIEKLILINQYWEDKMARDLYKYAYEKYWVETFLKISKSEQKHMEAVKALLDRYSIEAPTDYAADNELYKVLKKEAELGKKEAIEMWVKIEKKDIDSIVKAIKDTDNNDIKIVLTNIWWASYNHLRGFVKALKQNNFTTNIDYSNYLSSDEINIKWPLKYKLAEKLEKQWINLPEEVSSQNMKKKCKDKKWKNKNSWKKRWIDLELKNKYKKLIKEKHSSFIENMSKEKLEDFLVKITNFKNIVKNSSKYSMETKKRYWAILEALREIIEETI